MDEQGKEGMVGDLTEEWREIGARPIRTDAPAGAPARDDADFLAIQEEIHKMESLVGEPVDWNEVVSRGRTVLSERSKDLLAASYVCLGLFHAEGFQGLAAGFACVQEMAAHHWDALYPDAKRLQKRVDVLVWLREKLEAAVSGRSPSSHDREALQVCGELARTLDELLLQKLADKAPGLAGFRDLVQHQMEKVVQFSTKPGGDAQDPKPGGGQIQPGGAPGAISTAEECRSALREADQLVRRAAEFARSQDLSVPWPYRMVRAGSWVTLQMPAPLNNGVSRIPPPAPHLMDRYRTLEREGRWSQLLEQVESQFPHQPFWLDPHRMVIRALKELGPSYDLAKESVESEIKALVRRLPELPACRFSNEMLFADEKTRRWLDELQHSEVETASSEGKGNGKVIGDGKRVAELRLQAVALVEQGHMREAIGLLQKESGSIGSERDRFLLGLETAKLCLRADYPNVALSQLEGLDESITRFALDQWEPSLCLDVWITMWQLLQQRVSDSKRAVPEWATRCEALYRRICRLDVLSAWDMETNHASARQPP